MTNEKEEIVCSHCKQTMKNHTHTGLMECYYKIQLAKKDEMIRVMEEALRIGRLGMVSNISEICEVTLQKIEQMKEGK